MTDAGATDPSPSGRAGLFYGWRVVAAMFVTMTVSSGLGFYNTSVFLSALVRDSGYAVGTASMMTTEFFLVGAFTGLGVGRMIDRFDPRYTLCAGAVIAALGILAIGRATTTAELVGAYVLFAAGFAASGLVPCTTVVARWFHRNRATALSIASSGLSLGGITFTPLSAGLIDRLGFSVATHWIAAMYVVGVIPVTLLVLRASPAALGLYPDGMPPPTGKAAPLSDGVPYAIAIRARFFMLLTAAFTLILMAQVAGMTHLFNLGTERISQDAAASAVAAMAAASLTGRLIGGWLLTRIKIRPFAFTVICVQITGLALLAFINGAAGLVGVSVMFGLSIGNILMMLPLIVAETFGVRDYGKIYSTAQVVSQTGVAIGPGLLGLMHDKTHGYTLPLIAVASLSVIGAMLLWQAGPFPKPEHHPRSS